MKKYIKLILIMILFFSSLRAEAVVYSAAEVKMDVAKQVEKIYKTYTNAQISVNVVTLPFKDLKLPEGKVSYVVKSNATKFVPRDLEKVSVYVNGNCVRTFNAPVVVKAYEDVLVASSFINIGQEINPSVAHVQRVEISNKYGLQLKPEQLNKEMMAKKAFRDGEVLDRRFVKLKPDVVRSANVTLIFNTNNLNVSIEATALSDGVVGDNICLLSKTYNRTYTGRVIGENRVLVKL